MTHEKSKVITYLLLVTAQPCPLRDLLSCTTRMTRNTANYHSLSSAGTYPVQKVPKHLCTSSLNTLKTSEPPSNGQYSVMHTVLNYKEKMLWLNLGCDFPLVRMKLLTSVSKHCRYSTKQPDI